MTSQTARSGFQQRQFGTLTVIGWTGEYPEDQRDMPFLLVYSLGDGPDGPEAGERALRAMLEEARLPIGDELVDGAALGHQLPITLLVEGGQAVVTMPHFTAQYPATPEWLAAVGERGLIYFLFATQPWPQGVPGAAVEEQALRDFVTEEMMTSSAHCLLPVRGLKK